MDVFVISTNALHEFEVDGVLQKELSYGVSCVCISPNGHILSSNKERAVTSTADFSIANRSLF